jgi:hypothetical protein
MDHITRHLAPAESFNQLLRDPFCGRMGGYFGNFNCLLKLAA